LVSGNFGNGLTPSRFRLIAHSWLLVSLARVHSLGALRIIFLGLPGLLCALALSSLITTALWTWLVADLALAALR